ncbi:hypothetical protein TrVE_jg8175 [Triparma verrucosa]|uniref:Uncharacterized protein n=1 Tax=Triparma verrucosa TaxID=1606542 RepID=A0A9W7C8I5_9STRA|nr:hypothetical protein TrVE_jg8175 [Triparma verrucosa]
MNTSEPPVRRSYTVKSHGNKPKKKKNQAHQDTDHLSPAELLLHGVKTIFAVPYMSRHRNLHINLAIFLSFVNLVLHSLVLAHDLTIASLPYFTMSLTIRYNSFLVLQRDLTFGALRYLVGGDECEAATTVHDFTDPQCSLSVKGLSCKGFYVDENESHHLQSVCAVCAPSLSSSYRFFVIHASLHFFTLYLLFKRSDLRTDSPFVKQLTMLAALATALAASESAKYNDLCLHAAKSTTIDAFDDFDLTVEVGYCTEVTRLSMSYSYALFLGVMTTSSVSKKERKEAKAQIRGMAQLKKSGANLMDKVNSTDFSALARQKKEESLKFAKDLKAKSKTVYIDNKTANSRASAKFDTGPYKHDAVQAFS